jgi:hypothetical protein
VIRNGASIDQIMLNVKYGPRRSFLSLGCIESEEERDCTRSRICNQLACTAPSLLPHPLSYYIAGLPATKL